MIEVISVPVIATLVYWIINLIKYTTDNNEKVLRFVPLIAAGIGAVVGVLCFLLLPEIYVADNFLVAIIVGGASGLAATGTNQVIKQLSQTKTNDTTKSE